MTSKSTWVHQGGGKTGGQYAKPRLTEAAGKRPHLKYDVCGNRKTTLLNAAHLSCFLSVLGGCCFMYKQQQQNELLFIS